MPPRQTLQSALERERPLQIAGAINAYTARLAERAGFQALYVSGAGVANASFGLPDLGFTTLDQVAEDVRRITATTSLPVLVDIDTGWEEDLFTGRTMTVMHEAGAAAVHLEDQVSMKRCGHRPGKALVSREEMVARVEAAVKTKPDPSMVLMARTDAAAVEGLPAAIERAQAYVAAGADMIFAEALHTLEEYRAFTRAVSVPVLANITEFGKTPLFTRDELHSAGIAMALYPLSAFRAMSAAARDVYAALRRDGTQQAVIDRMQTRAELYDMLNYAEYERKADEKLNRKDERSR
ncbi:MAG TPA: methylisocitrate lyase [Kiritimatiellia bacterium]|nr:methylisocitrate lyase [Kiritimatiellia bacterium]HMO99772.1 methylisocitrate lyase [Kiritimatiellia bacterium]HMP97103.1 methylisocitrate lyase [Kiritimatiellia bacterium]